MNSLREPLKLSVVSGTSLLGQSPGTAFSLSHRNSNRDMQVPERGVFMGHRIDNHEPIMIPIEAFSTHMYMLGSSGSGKSRKMLSLGRNFVGLREPGFCFIDPAGDTVNDVLRYCILKRQGHRVILVDPGEGDWSVGLNMLAFDPELRNAPEQASAVMSMLSAVFGDEDLDDKPQLSRWMLNALTLLAQNGYTYAHMPLLLHSDRFRRELIAASRDPNLRLEWSEFDKATKQDRSTWKAPLFNRVNRFVLNPKIRRMFAQQHATFDPLRAMSQGKYVLVNLSSVPAQERSLVARGIIDMIYQAAWRRPEGQRRPFFLMLDEFDGYVSDDIGEVLMYLRKFGVSAILSHQSLDNLRKRPKVFAGVLSNCQLFGTFQCSVSDAEVMRDIHFTGQFRDDIPIPSTEIYHTVIIPHETTREVVTENWSETDSSNNSKTKSTAKTIGEAQSQGSSRTKGKAEHWAHSEGRTHVNSDTFGDSGMSGSSESTGYSYPLFGSSGASELMSEGAHMTMGSAMNTGTGWMSASGTADGTSEADTVGGSKSKSTTKSESTSKQNAQTAGEATSKGSGRARTHGVSVSRVPFHELEVTQELSSRQYHTPEALKEYAKAAVYNQQPRSFLLKQGRRPSISLESPHVELVRLSPSLEASARERILAQCAVRANEVDDELRATYAKYGIAFDDLRKEATNKGAGVESDGRDGTIEDEIDPSSWFENNDEPG